MGGKRANGRSSSGETMHPRISSAGSTKSSTMECSTANASFQRNNPDLLSNGLANIPGCNEQTSPEVQRKSSFDIISLLENQDDELLAGENENFASQRSENSSELPSFWHFVEPDPKHQDLFHRPIHHRHTNKEMKFSSDSNGVFPSAMKPPLAETIHINKTMNPKRSMKRRKTKKVQSAKTSGFKTQERSSERLRKEGREWLRVLTPPGTGSSCFDSVNNDSEEDELIRRYFSGLSSAGSSISWAEDAVESEFTMQLMKLWEDIQAVCAGEDRPDKMSDAVFNECMQWKKAFPNPDLHRFSSFRNEGNLSSPGSPAPAALDEDRDADATFSSLIQFPSPRSSTGGMKGHDDTMNQLQASFRSMNCSTPKPNIEKSTEYVSAWLSECQNACVPEENRSLLDSRDDRSLFPSHQAINSTSQRHCENLETSRNPSVHPSKLVADSERASYSHYSRNHAKLINEPDPSNFFTSLAITNNGIYRPLENKIPSTRYGVGTAMGADINNLPFGMPHFSNTNSYQNKINESDEEDEDGTNTPTEILSFRQNVRVQRPISSRIRDHAMTPIATGSNVHSSFGGRQHGMPSSAAVLNANSSENYRPKGRLRLFENFNDSTAPTSAKPDIGNAVNRTKSGFVRQGYSLGRSKQQPWSRHSGDDLTAEANYVTSLYENYPSSLGIRSIEEGVHDFTTTNSVGLNSSSPPSSAKVNLRYFERSREPNGSRSLTECEDVTFKPSVSWLMNH